MSTIQSAVKGEQVLAPMRSPIQQLTRDFIFDLERGEFHIESVCFGAHPSASILPLVPSVLFTRAMEIITDTGAFKFKVAWDWFLVDYGVHFAELEFVGSGVKTSKILEIDSQTAQKLWNLVEPAADDWLQNKGMLAESLKVPGVSLSNIAGPFAAFLK